MATVVGIDMSKVRRCTCRNCASIVEYTQSETRQESRTDYGGGSDTYWMLKCPQCGEDMSVGP